jgi:hypothetical protein
MASAPEDAAERQKDFREMNSAMDAATEMETDVTVETGMTTATGMMAAIGMMVVTGTKYILTNSTA